MKANELRIGNKFQDTKGNIYSVKYSTFRGIEIGSIENEPIPLTEEWLLKFGFEYYEEVDQWIQVNGIDRLSDYEINYYKKSMSGDYKWIDEDGYYIFDLELKIKYVHSLQNLFFALTGEELVISDQLKTYQVKVGDYTVHYRGAIGPAEE